MIVLIVSSQRESLSPQDLLAAIQAHVIYIIMRAVDGSSYIVGLNQQLLITYKVSAHPQIIDGPLANMHSIYASNSANVARDHFVKLMSSSPFRVGRTGSLPSLAEGLRTLS